MGESRSVERLLTIATINTRAIEGMVDVDTDPRMIPGLILGSSKLSLLS